MLQCWANTSVLPPDLPAEASCSAVSYLFFREAANNHLIYIFKWMSLIYSRLYVICKEKIVLALQRTSDNRKKKNKLRYFVFLINTKLQAENCNKKHNYKLFLLKI